MSQQFASIFAFDFEFDLNLDSIWTISTDLIEIKSTSRMSCTKMACYKTATIGLDGFNFVFDVDCSVIFNFDFDVKLIPFWFELLWFQLWLQNRFRFWLDLIKIMLASRMSCPNMAQAKTAPDTETHSMLRQLFLQGHVYVFFSHIHTFTLRSSSLRILCVT